MPRPFHFQKKKADGLLIFYNITSSNRVKVTKNQSTKRKYKGEFNIPNSVIHDNTTYYVEGIEADALRGNTSITSVTIPNSVTSIGSFAFSNCTGMISLKIGNSVTEIEDQAFFYCIDLTSVTVCNPQPGNIHLGSPYIFTFKDPLTKCVLYVPTGSKELYATANVWQDFAVIAEFDYEEEN